MECATWAWLWHSTPVVSVHDETNRLAGDGQDAFEITALGRDCIAEVERIDLSFSPADILDPARTQTGEK